MTGEYLEQSRSFGVFSPVRGAGMPLYVCAYLQHKEVAAATSSCILQLQAPRAAAAVTSLWRDYVVELRDSCAPVTSSSALWRMGLSTTLWPSRVAPDDSRSWDMYPCDLSLSIKVCLLESVLQ